MALKANGQNIESIICGHIVYTFDDNGNIERWAMTCVSGSRHMVNWTKMVNRLELDRVEINGYLLAGVKCLVCGY